MIEVADVKCFGRVRNEHLEPEGVGKRSGIRKRQVADNCATASVDDEIGNLPRCRTGGNLAGHRDLDREYPTIGGHAGFRERRSRRYSRGAAQPPIAAAPRCSYKANGGVNRGSNDPPKCIEESATRWTGPSP